MALIQDKAGNNFRVTENGLVPVEATSDMQAGALSLGGAAQRLKATAHEALGLSSPERIAAARAEVDQLDAQLSETNPASSFVGRHLTDIPSMMACGGKVVQGAIGAVEGAMQPAPDGMGQRAMNAVVGAGLGVGGAVGGEVLSSMAGRVTRAIGSAMPMVSNMTARAGEAVGDVMSPIAQRAKELGLALTPGQTSGNKTLQALETGYMSHPLMREPFDQMAEQNQKRITQIAADAAGINPQHLQLENGMIRPEALAEASAKLGDKFETIGKKLPDLEIGSNLKNTIEGISGISKLLKLSPEIAGDFEKGVIKGANYNEIRSAILEAASKEGGTLGRRIAGAADQLDEVATMNASGKQLEALARAREQWSMLDLLQSGESLNANGLVNAQTLSSKLKSRLGTRYNQELFSDMQPETADLVKAARVARSPDFRQLVGSSGTAERTAGIDAANEIASAARGDTGAIASILGKGKMGNAYLWMAEKNPKAFAELLTGNPAGLDEAARRGGAA